jgi:type IV secretory pathway TraG/TraD family ATPase VirD4
VVKAMRLKILLSGLVIISLLCCSSGQNGLTEVVSQEFNVYANVYFNDVWTAVEKSIAELEFTVKNQIKDKGLIDAEIPSTEEGSEAILLSAMIIEEMERIKVDCIVVLAGQEPQPERSLWYVKQFFAALEKNLGI